MFELGYYIIVWKGKHFYLDGYVLIYTFTSNPINLNPKPKPLIEPNQNCVPRYRVYTQNSSVYPKVFCIPKVCVWNVHPCMHCYQQKFTSYIRVDSGVRKCTYRQNVYYSKRARWQCMESENAAGLPSNALATRELKVEWKIASHTRGLMHTYGGLLWIKIDLLQSHRF